MKLTFAVVVGVSVGAVVGVGALQLRVPPLVQSVTAVLVAVLLSTGITFFLWLRSPGLSGGAGGGYFAFGSENVVSLGILLALAASLHGLLGVFSTALPRLVEYRALVLGCISGLYGSVSVATALESLAKLNLGAGLHTEHDVQTMRPVNTPLQPLWDELAWKHVAYDKSKILRVTRDGLEYLDDQGITCSIDFHTCHKNVQREVGSPGWIQVRESQDIYVGFRDSFAAPPYMMFASDPPTCFQFPMPKPAGAVPGQAFLRLAPAGFSSDFAQFMIRLIEAGVTTLDMS
jgi:hypothetical protein